MSNLSIPFNISLLDLNNEVLKGIKPVKVLDIYDNTRRTFHEDGLFSASIFGKVGEDTRSFRFSYIDIKIEVLHPILFKIISQLKSLYADIMAGKEFAVWNDEIKDFEKATALNGYTGYSFFIQHLNLIEFKESESDLRKKYIELITKYKDKALTSKVVVLPAGLRDIEINESGRPEENEVNTLYRKLLAVSNSIPDSGIKNNIEALDNQRWLLQDTFNQLFLYFRSIIEGKKKLVQGKWASRKIFNGTRNVISAMNPSVPTLGDHNNVSFNDTIVGLFQFMKSTLPVSIYHIRNEILSKIFINKDLPVKLVDKETLKSVDIKLQSEYFDRYMSDAGIEKIIESFRDEYIRHKEIEIKGYYLALIYKGPDGTFKIFNDIDDLPEGKDRKYVYPITFTELLYLSLYKYSRKYPCFVTRYPIAGIGSIYPSYNYLKTTVKTESRKELSDNWEVVDSNPIANEFPIRDQPFLNSLVPHPSRVKGLVADYDGDTSSSNSVYSDNAIKEIDEFFASRKAYLGTDGKILHSVYTDTTKYVIFNLTRTQ